MRKASFKKSYVLLATVLLAVCGFFVYRFAQAHTSGDPVTGLDVPTNVLQLGETTTRTAATTEPGASDWTSSASSTVATIDAVTGVVAAIGAGTTTIAYATSTDGDLNSTTVTVYAAATIDNPAIGTVQVGEGDVTPTDFTAAGTGETIAWQSSVPAKATIVAGTGVITPVAEGTTTIGYIVTETLTGRIVAKGNLEITVEAAATIDNPAIGTVQVGEGDVTPTDFTAAGTGETIAWQSSVPAKATIVAGTGVITPVAEGTTTIGYIVTETLTGRIVAKGNLEITVEAAEPTFDIVAISVTAIAAIIGTPQFGQELTAGALTPSGATVTYQWQSATTSGGTYTDISGATSDTYTLVTGDAAKYLKVAATGTGGYSDTATSAATAVVAAAHHSRNGGGGTVTLPAAPLTTEQLQTTVDSLIARINALIAQAKALGIQLQQGTGNLLTGSGGAGTPIVLSGVLRPLLLGSIGNDVKALQNFLISQNKGSAAENLKRHGATTIFGPLTRAALAEFQRSVGLPATGYFGSLTKAYLKTLGF